MMNQNLQTIKCKVSNDFSNHQWVLTYGEVNRIVDFCKSDEYVKEVIEDMIIEHRDNQIKKIINDNESI